MFEGNAVRSHEASITGEGRAASEHRDKFSIPLDGKAEKSKGENPSGTKPNTDAHHQLWTPVVEESTEEKRAPRCACLRMGRTYLMIMCVR